MTDLSKHNNWPYGMVKTAFILAPIILSFALAMDIYMPMLPEMKKVLNTTPRMIQLTLSIYFLVGGVGQLIIGPISDSYGRYKVLLVSSVFFFIGSFGCIFSNINWLLFFRFIEAIGACGMFVTAFAMVRDIFSDKKSAVMYSLLNAMVALSPIVGPIIGVIISKYFSWYVAFYILSFFSLCSISIIIFQIRETLPFNRRNILTLYSFTNYIKISMNITFWSYTIPATVAVTSFFTLFSITPYIILSCGGPSDDIIYFFGLVGLGFMIGSIAASLFIKRIGIFITILLGLVLMCIGGIVIISLNLFYGLNLVAIYIPMTLVTFGGALTAGCSASGALEPFKQLAGSASALFGAVELGVSALLGTFIVSYSSVSPIPLSIVIILGSLISMVFLISIRR